MGIVPQITCRNCQKTYSGLKNKCPYCGEERKRASTRSTVSASSVQSGTSAAGRAQYNAKWQMIFGVILIAAIVLAVIVLISVSLKGGSDDQPNHDVSPSPVLTPSPTPSPSPTPIPSPTPAVTSITISSYGRATTDFSLDIAEEVQLTATVYPLDVAAEVEWSSEDESIAYIDENGKVMGISSGNTTVYCKSGAITASCIVRVR